MTYSSHTLRCMISLLLISLFSCSDSQTKIIHEERNKIIDVSGAINTIDLEILIGSSRLYILDDYLVAVERQHSNEKGIHLFNKYDFSYVTSTGVLGNGPGEITRYGRLGMDRINRSFWMPDHGKRVMWRFPIDSVLNNSDFKPTDKLVLHDEFFNTHFELINDSIGIGNAVQVLGPSDFRMRTSKLNIKSNRIETYGYEHPKLNGSRTSKAGISIENNCYVKVYSDYDLLTICDLDGDLIYDIYGPDWTNEIQKVEYFTDVDFLDNYVFVSYTGEDRFVFDESKRPRGNDPKKIQVFKTDGQYTGTLDFGTSFRSFCIDGGSNTLIVYFTEKDDPLGYLSLDDILDLE